MASREPKTDRKRPWPKGRKPTAATPFVDNRQFFDTEGAARRLKITTDYCMKLAQRGLLTPGRAGTSEGLVFTLADLQRYLTRERKEHRERRVLELLQQGKHPVDVFFELEPEGIKLAHVVRVLHQWVKLGGIWVIEGPPGSYARWLERMNLARLTPRNLRRLIEHMLSDPSAAERAGAWVSANRVSLQETAPADSGPGALSSSCEPSSETSEPSSSVASSPP